MLRVEVHFKSSMATALGTAEETLSIGDVARRAGVETSAIRYYERVGLLPPAERRSGRRRYGEDVLELLSVVAIAKQAGFSLAEIKRLLRGFDPSTPPPERWRRMAEGKLEELDALSQRIEGMRALLRRGLECGCLRLEDCELLHPRAALAAQGEPDR